MISAMLNKIDELDKQNTELQAENRSLREALKQSRQFARDVGYSSQMFAAQIGITASQLSVWTDSTPTTEPDFKGQDERSDSPS